MVEFNIEKEIPMGMVTYYSDSMKEAVKKYITENKRVKTPIIKYLKSLIDSFEMQLLGNMISTSTFYCIHHIEIDVDRFKIHFVNINIDNSDLDNIRTKDGGIGSVGGNLLNFNKNYIKFLQKLNEDIEITEEKCKYEIAIFSKKIDDQFKQLREIRTRFTGN